jgi:leucine dehydrogenase
VHFEPGELDPRRVLEIKHAASGLEAFLVVDSVQDGLTAGGIRRASYPDADAAREEAKRLARAMKLKTRIAKLPTGGAKTVIRDTDDLDVAEAYRVLGRQIDRMDPAYLAGPDLGTGDEELAYVREKTDRVNPKQNDPGRATAVGVLSGIQAVMEAITGVPSSEGGTFLVQGYGAVGANVARGLDDQGGMVFVTDTAPDKLDEAEDAGFETVGPDTWIDEEVNVFVPCATGDVVDEQVAREIAADGICGSANNPLTSRKAAETLHERGVFYAPDVVVNSGAIIEGILTWTEGDSPRVQDQIDRKISGVYERTRDVLDQAFREDVPPTEIVRRRWA